MFTELDVLCIGGHTELIVLNTSTFTEVTKSASNSCLIKRGRLPNIEVLHTYEEMMKKLQVLRNYP